MESAKSALEKITQFQLSKRRGDYFSCYRTARQYAERLIDAMATGYLVAVLESICLREMQWHLNADEETVVGASIQCHHRGPIPPGAVINVTGWVEGLGDHDATFRVQAQDDNEQVCDGTIRFSVARRELMQRRIDHKCKAIAQRELLVGE